MGLLNGLIKFFVGTVERPSPSNIIDSDHIAIINNSILIALNNAWGIPWVHSPKVWIPSIPDTNSMDGTFDMGNNNLLIAGRNDIDQDALVAKLSVGDIAVYRSPKMYAIHRIIKIAEDKQGKYFIFKGDNNPSRDPARVRPKQIEWVSIGTIY